MLRHRPRAAHPRPARAGRRPRRRGGRRRRRTAGHPSTRRRRRADPRGKRPLYQAPAIDAPPSVGTKETVAAVPPTVTCARGAVSQTIAPPTSAAAPTLTATVATLPSVSASLRWDTPVGEQTFGLLGQSFLESLSFALARMANTPAVASPASPTAPTTMPAVRCPEPAGGGASLEGTAAGAAADGEEEGGAVTAGADTAGAASAGRGSS